MKTNYFKSAMVLFTMSSLFIISLNTETGFSKSFSQFNKISVTLQYHVFTVSREGITRDPAMPATPEKLKWVANSSTLIYGRHDAVLIDCFLTIDQTNQLIDSIIASGKHLKYIYITHPHGDHFFGLQLLLDRFPDAKAISSPDAVADMAALIKPEVVNAFWGKLFPNQIPARLTVPKAMRGSSFELEGNKIDVIETGFTDTHNSTSIWVPSIKLLVAGDVVYNGIYPYLHETTTATRLQWVAVLGKLEKLHPAHVVAGHKNPVLTDSPKTIEATANYLLNFNRLVDESATAVELYNKMFALYPDFVNPGSLWGAAKSAKK
jgi:glyoxylase-like metal-dependent hydrolase (beta-lactamase superfamily II)